MSRRPVLLGIALGIAALAIPMQLRASGTVALGLLRASDGVRAPFQVSTIPGAITKVEREAVEAGLEVGATVRRIDGNPYVGSVVLDRALRTARPGGTIAVVVAAPDGSERSALVRLESAGGLRPDVAIIAVTLAILMPLLCLALGLWVVVVRPGDPLAWLVYGLMLGFSQINNPDVTGWAPGLREAGTFVNQTLKGTWGLWMCLFGLYFPEPFGWVRRARPAIVALAALVGLHAAFRGILEAAAIAHLPSVLPIASVSAPVDRAFGWIAIACISSFFMSIGAKSGMHANLDARRRLRVLAAGGSAALAPSFILIVLGVLDRIAPAGSPWRTPIVAAALVPLLLFPVTMAYVIVVQRAMDVRVALRMGARYLLAKNGLRVAIFLFMLPLGLLIMRFVLRSDQTSAVKAAAVGAYVAVFTAVFLTARRMFREIDRRFFREAYDEEQVLTDLADQVRTMVDAKALIETLANRVAEAIHIEKIAVLIPEGGVFRAAYAKGYAAGDIPVLPELGRTAAHLREAGSPETVHFDVKDSWLHRGGGLPEEERNALRALDAETLVPLTARGRLQGILGLGPKRSEQPYSRLDLRLLRSVATQAGMALENSRLAAEFAAEVAKRERMNREIEIAREVQEGLFPQKLPEVPGVDLAGACRPAAGIGGDYWDFFALDRGRLALAVGDVAGKGIPAALLMASLQASLRGQTLHETEDLTRLMRDINRLVFDASPSNRYATFFYGQYDPVTRRLDFVNAGHNAPMVFRPSDGGGEILRLEKGGMVVGLMDEAAYRQDAILLEPGDVVVGFSDGISEAMNAAEEEWGEARLVDVIRANATLSARELLGRIFEEADRFVAGAKQHDDMTVVVLRVL